MGRRGRQSGGSARGRFGAGQEEGIVDTRNLLGLLSLRYGDGLAHRLAAEAVEALDQEDGAAPDPSAIHGLKEAGERGTLSDVAPPVRGDEGGERPPCIEKGEV